MNGGEASTYLPHSDTCCSPFDCATDDVAPESATTVGISLFIVAYRSSSRDSVGGSACIPCCCLDHCGGGGGLSLPRFSCAVWFAMSVCRSSTIDSTFSLNASNRAIDTMIFSVALSQWTLFVTVLYRFVDSFHVGFVPSRGFV